MVMFFGLAPLFESPFAPPAAWTQRGSLPEKTDPQNSCACRQHTFHHTGNMSTRVHYAKTRTYPLSFSDSAVRACVHALSLTLDEGRIPSFSCPRCCSTAPNLLHVHLAFWLSARLKHKLELRCCRRLVACQDTRMCCGTHKGI